MGLLSRTIQTSIGNRLLENDRKEAIKSSIRHKSLDNYSNFHGKQIVRQWSWDNNKLFCNSNFHKNKTLRLGSKHLREFDY